jgi:hypothetical protein
MAERELTRAARYRDRRVAELIARNTKHGLHRAPENAIWREMKQRCTNPKSRKYPRYGGRGIRVCPAWDLFEQFYADMGPRPSPAHSIDRTDNDGNYEPGNCRWRTRSEQQRNRRNNHLLTYQGKTQTIAAWAEETGLRPMTLSYRISAGWGTELALTTLPQVSRYGAPQGFTGVQEVVTP